MNTKELESALLLKSNGMFDEALRALEPLCSSGQHALACWHLAEMYENGLGVEQDQLTARSLFEKAARSGDPWFRHSFGRYLERTNDRKAAFEVIEENAGLGFIPSVFRLGVYFENGVGTEKDVEKGRILILRAESEGHVFAARHRAGKRLRGEEGLLMRPIGLLRILYIALKTISIGRNDPWDPRLVN